VINNTTVLTVGHLEQVLLKTGKVLLLQTNAEIDLML
jgi:hypothetical protein